MDINTLRGLSTIFVMVAFLGICWWAFSPRRKKRFEEDARLPFADEEAHQQTQEHDRAGPDADSGTPAGNEQSSKRGTGADKDKGQD